MEPPAGVLPDFVDPPSYYNTLLILSIIWTLSMIALVAVRLGIKGFSKALWWDDQTKVGLGRHMWDIPVTWLIREENLKVNPALRTLHRTV
ncbi:hypothetical protein SLS58_005966 [Diplodia intermedia]|uniref:ATP synthase F0 subunit 8 n=1 Tax=Diplodia intermedia TaxID=856260 RepID=A0ABR3TPC7_9PEZI